MVDEAGQYATPNLIDKLRSNMRGPSGMPIRQVIAANPGDVGHAWLAARYVFKSKPWLPFHEPMTDAPFVYAPSTYRDNPFIDADKYRASLEASCPADPELLRAWLDGDWAINRGAFFGMVLSEQRNSIDPWTLPLNLKKRRIYAGNGCYLQPAGPVALLHLSRFWCKRSNLCRHLCRESGREGS